MYLIKHKTYIFLGECMPSIHQVFVCNYIILLIFIQKSVASGMFGYPETSLPWQTPVWSSRALSFIRPVSGHTVAFMASGTLDSPIPSFFLLSSSRHVQMSCTRATRAAQSCWVTCSRGTAPCSSTTLGQSTQGNTIFVQTSAEPICTPSLTILSSRFWVNHSTFFKLPVLHHKQQRS